MKKKILTDCDGVLLDWEQKVHEWMVYQGYERVNTEDHYFVHIMYGMERAGMRRLIQQFNESAWIGYLEPLRDSVKVIRELYEMGYEFEVITSLSTDPYAKKLREQNLERYFGNAISNVICLETGADKDDILKTYDPGYIWVEDKPENAIAGADAGHHSFLIEHHYNHYMSDDKRVQVVKNWHELKEKIIDCS